jgi:4-amino-4-deoxy-L-arabinose transferase-like glycosyltransferase
MRRWRESRRVRDLAVLAAVLAAALTALWIGLPGQWRENQNFDYTTYYEPVARRLLAGGGFREPSGAPAAHYPPGFSLLLAAVFGLAGWTGAGEDLVFKVFVLLCDLASVALVYLIAERAGGRKLGLAAGLLWATYPFFLWLSKQPNSETPFLVLLLLASYLFLRLATGDLRYVTALGAGVAAGMASLIRPSAVGYGALLAGLLLFLLKEVPVARRSALALVLAAGNLAAVAPWELWVYSADGEKIVLGRNVANSLKDGMTFAMTAKASGKPLPVGDDIRGLMQRAYADPSSTRSVPAVARFLAGEVKVRPLTVVRFLWLKARRAWFGTHGQWLETPIACIQIVYLSAACAGLVFLWRSGEPARKRFAVLAIAASLYFWGLTVLVLPLLRYMIGAMALLVVADAVVALESLHRLTRRRSSVIAMESAPGGRP